MFEFIREAPGQLFSAAILLESLRREERRIRFEWSIIDRCRFYDDLPGTVWTEHIIVPLERGLDEDRGTITIPLMTSHPLGHDSIQHHGKTGTLVRMR